MDLHNNICINLVSLYHMVIYKIFKYSRVICDPFRKFTKHFTAINKNGYGIVVFIKLSVNYIDEDMFAFLDI